MGKKLKPLEALLFKEWLKSRYVVLGGVVLWGVVLVLTVLLVQRALRLEGGLTVWTMVLFKDLNLVHLFKWLPLLVGVVLGSAQFVPELQQHRLKLTLHLPLSDFRLLGTMLSYGYVFQLVLDLVVVSVTVGFLLVRFPREIVWATLTSTVPWFAMGLGGYGVVAWLCVEPSLRRRVGCALFAVVWLYVGYLSEGLQAYAGFGWVLVCWSLLVVPLLIFSALVRFREGASRSAVSLWCPWMQKCHAEE